MLISVFKMQRSSVQIITLLTVAILVIPAHLQGQTADETETPPSATESAPPKDTNLPGQQIQQMGEADAQMMKSEGMNQMVQTSISNYPLITEITGNSITINRGEDYWVMDGQIIEIWKLEPQMKKIGQARITKVGSATSMAQVLGEPRIEVNDRVRVHPEVTGFESSKITIDRGSNQGLMLGWVVTLWRLGAVNSMQSSAVDSKPQMRKIVGRAVLTEVQPDTSTGRLLGKAMTQPSGGDLIRVERQTTVRQKSGSTVYLDVATDLINILKPGMKVYVFRPYTLMHPDGNHRIVRWEEQIATLKVNHVAEASYTARASIDGIAQR